MENGVIQLSSGDDLAWAERCEYWSFAARSTDDELVLAQAQWHQFVRILTTALPGLNEKGDGLAAADFLSARFSVQCLLPFLELMKRGKRRELSITLENVSDFVRKHAIPQCLPSALARFDLDREFRSDLVSLVTNLSLLWRHCG
jgi:hypothetical protein